MNILITGGAGYLGSVLVSALLSRGDRVTVVDICMFGAEGLMPHMGNPNFSFIIGDISDTECTNKILFQSFDAVVHLAALVGEPACSDPHLTKQINTDATIQLAMRAKKMGVKRFIFTSTCSNYGVTSPNSFARESSVLHPLTLYAETKIAAERGLLALSDGTFSVTILRLAMLFGLSPKMRFNLLINEIVRDASFGRDIVLYKEDAWRPFAHTRDVASAIIKTLIASKKVIAGEVFNIGTENIQKKSLVSLVKKYIPSTRVVVKGGAPDDRDYRVSFAKAKKYLGFVPTMSIQDGIEEIVWALQHNIWSNPNDPKYSEWLRVEFFK